MRYATANAFRTALETRLLTRARESGVSIVRLRKTVVFERLLARLLVVAPGRWHLKGALALDFRLGPGVRATQDMDLGRDDDEAASTADFRAVEATDLGDWFVFAIARTSALDQIADGAAVRYQVAATLAGRPFEWVTVDIGFGGSPPAPDALRGPDLLAFADIARLTIPTLPLERHVAEKLHAYTRDYGNDRQNTRAKDLVDLVLIEAMCAFKADSLRAALEATFAARGLQPLPAALPPVPGAWEAPYRILAREVDLPPDVADGVRAVAAFLDPVLAEQIGERARWNPAAGRWEMPSA
ncbi:MAG: nucleotidyl transferase AbiEii/AbiGii toxin family protein [Thermomicrobiales bacterium]